MSTKTLFGLIEFSSPIFCSADALGKTVDITIGTQAGTLTLPSLPAWGAKEEGPLDKCLVAPDEAQMWKRGGKDPLYWGRPDNYPSGESSVKLALLKMDLPQDDFESASQEVYKHFPAWIALFEQYVTLLTTQKTRVSDESGPGHLELLTYEEDKLTYIPTTRTHHMTVYMGGGDESLHFEQLEKAASFSSKNLSPRLEYKMLLQAYIARHEEDYRKAIIEAASALEISLTKRLEEEFQNQNISFGQKLLKKIAC
jgi:hypothetical protein